MMIRNVVQSKDMLAHALGITICDATASPIDVEEELLVGLTKDLVELRNLTGLDVLKSFIIHHKGKDYKVHKQVFSSSKSEIIYWLFCL